MFIKQFSVAESCFFFLYTPTEMNRLRAFALYFAIVLCMIVCNATPICNTVTLDSCRMWALRYNKTLQIAHETVEQSACLRRAARGAYLPAIDFAGAYFYNQKPTRLVDVDNLRSAISQLGVSASWASVFIPDDFLELDTRQVAIGAVTLAQPIYMGGKILAMNDMATNAELLAHSQRNLTEIEVITAVDDVYWLVVSLEHKLQLAQSFVSLLENLHNDMTDLINEGLATQSDGLAVSVAKNEADVMLTKAENGLVSARMMLAQLCGMPIDTVFELRDVVFFQEPPMLASYAMSGIYSRREEVQSLRILSRMAHAQQRLALSAMLPSVALVGMYSLSLPNLYNGFKTSFDGMFSVGVMVHIPIFHWGTDYYRYKAACSVVTIANIEIEAAKDRIALQVNEARHRYNEAGAIYKMCVKNSEQAELNLRNAQYAFDEGVYTYTQLLAAQTAWREASSELIDARVAVSVAYDSYTRAVGLPLY